MEIYDVNRTAQRLSQVIEQEFATKREACKHLGVKPATLKNYITGKSRVKPDVLFDISLLTGVSSDYLLGLVDEVK